MLASLMSTWSCLSESQAQKGTRARNTCSRSPSVSVFSSFFSKCTVLWNKKSSGNDLFSSFPFTPERWEHIYQRFFQHPRLFDLQHSINTSEASLYHMLYKPRAKDNPCPEQFTLQTEQTHGGKEKQLLLPLLQGKIFGQRKQFSNPWLQCLCLWKHAELFLQKKQSQVTS